MARCNPVSAGRGSTITSIQLPHGGAISLHLTGEAAAFITKFITLRLGVSQLPAS
jgi:hypothetical protein